MVKVGEGRGEGAGKHVEQTSGTRLRYEALRAVFALDVSAIVREGDGNVVLCGRRHRRSTLLDSF